MTVENHLILVLQNRVSLVTRKFPKSFNRLRNVNEMYTVDEAYSILNSHNLLKIPMNLLTNALIITQFIHASFSSNQKKV